MSNVVRQKESVIFKGRIEVIKDVDMEEMKGLSDGSEMDGRDIREKE